MTDFVQKFSEVSVHVCGDVMLDRHVYGQVRRISPEAPVPVVNFVREHQTPGGAGHVAASVAGLGCGVTLAGLIGDDPEGVELSRALAAQGVARFLSASPKGLTTVSETRSLSDTHQQILRLDRDGSRDAFSAAAARLLDVVVPDVGGHGAVILSDYGKGALTPALIAGLIRVCRGRGIPCVVDPKKGRPVGLCRGDRPGAQHSRGRARGGSTVAGRARSPKRPKTSG